MWIWNVAWPERKLTARLLLGDPQAVEPWRDPEVWKMIASGHGRAVHHIESPAMTSLCRMCNVNEIDGLVAIVSVIRPGAANEGKKMSFTRRYQGMEPIEYPHPSLESCLRSTYGLVVYEEHILQICEAFAGLPPGRADVLRRALNKQKRAVIAEIREEFFTAALTARTLAGKDRGGVGIGHGFAGYAFCKAHSTAYGVEAYQSAWLKRYYPAEFMAAVLTNGKGFYHPLVYVLESHRLGLKFLPPSVNEPGPAFVPHGNAIRVPVTRVKGLTIAYDRGHAASARARRVHLAGQLLSPGRSRGGGIGGDDSAGALTSLGKPAPASSGRRNISSKPTPAMPNPIKAGSSRRPDWSNSCQFHSPSPRAGKAAGRDGVVRLRRQWSSLGTVSRCGVGQLLPGESPGRIRGRNRHDLRLWSLSSARITRSPANR
jgi:hypothetical protein